MPPFSLMFRPASPKNKQTVKIVNIFFHGPNAATLIASSKKNAENIKGFLQVLILHSGKDGNPPLYLTIEKSEKDADIEISGNNVLDVLELFSISKPSPLSAKSIRQLEIMLKSAPKNRDPERALLITSH